VADDFSPTPRQQGTTRLSGRRVAPLARSRSVRRTSTSVWRARTSGRKPCTAKTLPMTRTTTTDAFEGTAACVDLMVTLEAPKASPSSPTLEGQTTLKTFRLKQRRRLTARATALPTCTQPSPCSSTFCLPACPLVSRCAIGQAVGAVLIAHRRRLCRELAHM
jgi:hypothetical protein